MKNIIVLVLSFLCSFGCATREDIFIEKMSNKLPKIVEKITTRNLDKENQEVYNIISDSDYAINNPQEILDKINSLSLRNKRLDILVSYLFEFYIEQPQLSYETKYKTIEFIKDSLIKVMSDDITYVNFIYNPFDIIYNFGSLDNFCEKMNYIDKEDYLKYKYGEKNLFLDEVLPYFDEI